MNKHLLRTHWPLHLLLLLATGCGGAGDSAGAGQGSLKKVRAMGDLYVAHLTERHGAPADEAAWRSFLNQKQAELQAAGLTVDDMFVSPKSGAPLTWVYGKPPQSHFGLTVVAFEPTPVDGRRFVVATNGMTDNLDETRFQALKLGAAK